MIISTATFQSTLGAVFVGFSPMSVTLVTGPNGAGKSALLYQLYRALPQGAATYLPGHRQINFNNALDQIGQDIAQLQLNAYNHFDAFNRYKGAWSEDQFKATLRVLMHAESAFNRNFRHQVAACGVAAIPSASLRDSPVDTLNLVFSTSGFQVSFILDDRGLTAIKAGKSYSVEALSDGERAALFIASALITQPAATTLLIDEPEKHLNPSISGLLIETAIRTRNDVAVVLSTHDVSLIERLNAQSILYIKDSQVLSLRPEMRSFDVELIQEGALPEGLKADVLGSRSRVLFVEGTEKSRDAALYANVYPTQKVVSKGGADKVIEAVNGLAGSGSLHWLTVSGLIDSDGRTDPELKKLAQRGVVALPTPTVENLFFLEDMQKCFVEADLAMRGGLSWNDRQRNLERAVAAIVVTAREEIEARRVCWAIQRVINAHPFSVKTIRNETAQDLTININPIKHMVSEEVEEILKKGVREILINLPIKNTDVPDTAARALGATSFKTYCSVIQRQIDVQTEGGLRALYALKAKLPSLETAAATSPPQLSVVGPRYIGMPDPQYFVTTASFSQ